MLLNASVLLFILYLYARTELHVLFICYGPLQNFLVSCERL
jgi:hypothetical protein